MGPTGRVEKIVSLKCLVPSGDSTNLPRSVDFTQLPATSRHWSGYSACFYAFGFGRNLDWLLLPSESTADRELGRRAVSSQ